MVSVFQATLDLLRQLQMHPEVASQMLAYLFFFSGTLLLNQVLDKGEWWWGWDLGSFEKAKCALKGTLCLAEPVVGWLKTQDRTKAQSMR